MLGNVRFGLECRRMESLCRELSELSPKLPLEVLGLDSEAAKHHGVDFSPTLLLAPDRCRIRYLGAPLGEEGRTLIETILRLSAGKSGLSQTSKNLLAELTEERHVQVFVNPACPYCPGQVSNAFRCAIERPDLVSAVSIDTTQHPDLAAKYQVGSVPQTVINDSLTDLGLLPEERFVAELVTLKKIDDLPAEHQPGLDGDMDIREVDLVVAGAGPAGLTAAIYAVRSGLTAVVLEKNIIGGQVTITPVVENYPGFANVPGKKLMILLTDGDTEDGRCGGSYASASKTINQYWTNAYFGLGLSPTTATSPYSTLSTATATLAQIPSCVDGGKLNQYALDEATAAKTDANYPVEIFTIRFGDSDATDKSLMQQIASSKTGTTDHYYDAPSESDIQAMFKKIGQQLGQRLMTVKEATTGTP